LPRLPTRFENRIVGSRELAVDRHSELFIAHITQASPEQG
jgi:hypothetical protein